MDRLHPSEGCDGGSSPLGGTKKHNTMKTKPESIIAEYIDKHVFDGASVFDIVYADDPRIPVSRKNGYDVAFGWRSYPSQKRWEDLKLYDVALQQFLRQQLNHWIQGNSFDFWYSWRIPGYSGPTYFETTLRLSTEDFAKLEGLAQDYVLRQSSS